MKNKSHPDKKKVIRTRRIAYTAASVIFMLTLAGLFTFSFDFVHRETFSESEKRELAKFPDFSVEALASGDYFDDINLWFSDTFPFRDTLIKASSTVKKCLGIGQTIHNFSENTADIIPEVEAESQSSVDIVPAIPEKTTAKEKPTLPVADKFTNPANGDANGNIIEQNFSSIYIYGNTAYEYYNFVRSTADSYVAAVNKGANEAKSYGINYYNMLIPTGIDITLDDTARQKLNSSDQKSAINYMNSLMNENVKKVHIFDLLKEHSKEYIYFRTDHHWTTLGAYYAYAQYMTVKGDSYKALSDFTEYEFNGFLGSFYSDTDKNSALEAAPDTVYAYVPDDDISFTMLQSGASDFIDWPLVCDVTEYSPSYKYLCFIGGDNPVSVIENNSLPDGDVCVFVKESFGNAFAPFLAASYKTVYVIDYRHFDGDITDFAKEKEATDILVQNNISMTRNPSLVEKLNETI